MALKIFSLQISQSPNKISSPLTSFNNPLPFPSKNQEGSNKVEQKRGKKLIKQLSELYLKFVKAVTFNLKSRYNTEKQKFSRNQKECFCFIHIYKISDCHITSCSVTALYFLALSIQMMRKCLFTFNKGFIYKHLI